jgi:hypothetical protein
MHYRNGDVKIDRKPQPQTFVSELEQLIDKYSLENQSNTPDFILAEYLRGCLDVFSKTVDSRDKFLRINKYGCEETSFGAAEPVKADVELGSMMQSVPHNIWST